MNFYSWRYRLVALALVASLPIAAAAQDFPELPAEQVEASDPRAFDPEAFDAEAIDPNIDVLTSGPVHEAFAGVMQVDPEPGIVINLAPPDPIEELPPEVLPEGDVVWIPGYWAFSEDMDDFIWVSGVWRQIPPGYVWIPGYWQEVDDGWQWITGYWEPEQLEEVVYLPVPPESLEVGPSSPPPGDGYFWVPGHWVWQSARYVWQPGYWAVIQQDWVWVPSHYVWSPSGCVYIDGYWDYPLQRRGFLFAPVYFSRPIYTRPAFRLVPRTIINTALLITHLFARPAYGHYYFGDYYSPNYLRSGIYPWYAYQNRGFGYDPLFWYYGAGYRGGYNAWTNLVRDRYRYYRSNDRFRPPRTFRQQLELVGRGDFDRNRIAMGERLSDVVANAEDRGVRLERIDDQRQRQIAEATREFRQYTRARARAETQAARQRGGDRRDFDPIRIDRTRSPLASLRASDPDSDGDSDRPTDAQGRRGRRSGQDLAPPPDRPRAARSGDRSARGTDSRDRSARAADRERDRPDTRAGRDADRSAPTARGARPRSGDDLSPPEDRGRGSTADRAAGEAADRSDLLRARRAAEVRRQQELRRFDQDGRGRSDARPPASDSRLDRPDRGRFDDSLRRRDPSGRDSLRRPDRSPAPSSRRPDRASVGSPSIDRAAEAARQAQLRRQLDLQRGGARPDPRRSPGSSAAGRDPRGRPDLSPPSDRGRGRTTLRLPTPDSSDQLRAARARQAQQQPQQRRQVESMRRTMRPPADMGRSSGRAVGRSADRSSRGGQVQTPSSRRGPEASSQGGRPDRSEAQRSRDRRERERGRSKD